MLLPSRYNIYIYIEDTNLSTCWSVNNCLEILFKIKGEGLLVSEGRKRERMKKRKRFEILLASDFGRHGIPTRVSSFFRRIHINEGVKLTIEKR